jgi:hypothetical protein
MPKKDIGQLPQEHIESRIYLIRGERVMLDTDLAELYGVEAKHLKRQVMRNRDRFPTDFMFVLTPAEHDFLRCQFGTLKRGQHSKYLPFAFTENGVAMLSSVLNSSRAIQVNIRIMRIFTKIRVLLISNKDILRRLDQLEAGQIEHGEQIVRIFEAIRSILSLPVTIKRKGRRIGFIPST